MDDQSLKPMSPALEFDTIAEEPVVDPSDVQIAKTYYNDEIEQIISEQLDSWGNVASIKSDLPATEFKTEALANQKASALVKAIWEKIKNARTAVENAGNTKSRSK